MHKMCSMSRRILEYMNKLLCNVPMSASMVELTCICLLGVGGAAICDRVLGDTCDVVK